MNYVNTNRINNFFYMYSIKKTEENFKKLEKVIEERKFIIYRKILYMIENCQIIEEDSTGIIIEIEVEKKLDTHFVGNPFLAIKIYNSF